MIESAVPAIAIASVRPIAATTTRKKSGDRSGGKRLRRKLQTEAKVLAWKNTDGRTSAARQQRISNTPSASAIATRQSVRMKLGRRSRQPLTRAASGMAGFMLCLTSIAHGRFLRSGIAVIEFIERFAAHLHSRLIEDDTPLA